MSHIDGLAQFLADTHATPTPARAAAARCVLDLVTAALVGLKSESGQAARAAAPVIWGGGNSVCWFGGPRLTIAGATYANAAIASALDLDDGHRVAAGHPGAAVIPAVLAAADVTPTAPEAILDAIAIGYEIGVRIAGARDFATLDSTSTGRWCGQGVAAALAWFANLPAGRIAQAIGLAQGSAPSLKIVGYGTDAGHLKEGIPWAAATGTSSAQLAAAGTTGSLAALDDERQFDGSRLTAGLGARWLIETTYYKPYSVCRWAHAALDAVEMLLGEGMPVGAIDRLEIHTFSRALTLSNQAAPTSMEGAQYSIPFAVALRLLRGRAALLPLRSAALGDDEAKQLAARISLHLDPDLEAMFSARVPARVVVHAGDRRWTKTVLDPLGEPTNPMDWQALLGKLRTATRDIVAGASAAQLDAALAALHAGQLRALQDFLHAPLNPA